MDTSQLKKFDDCKNIYSVNHLYLLIDHAGRYIEEKKLLTKYNDVRNEIKDKIKENNSGKCDYEKDYMKIKLNSDDNLPLNKPSKFRNMTIIIRCVFSEDDKLFHKFL